MNDVIATIWLAIVWVVNGFLVGVYFAVDRFLVIILIISVILFAAYTPKEQRLWAGSAGVLSILASFIAPSPVPLFLLVMAIAGWGAQFREKYNRPGQRWNTIRWLILYSLAGLGYTVVVDFGILNVTSTSDPMMAQGAGYLSTIITIAMFIIPLGFLAMLAQAVTALPPASGTPEQMITQIRTRGKN